MIHEQAQARRIALQGLYQADAQGEEFLRGGAEGWQGFVEQATNDLKIRELASYMVREAWAYHAKADEWMTRLVPKWPVHRMAVVDRNILRLAVYEMSELETPSPVVIDEALELARQFSGDESVSFINGVLDAVRRDAS